jgi:hypothetical protein
MPCIAVQASFVSRMDRKRLDPVEHIQVLSVVAGLWLHNTCSMYKAGLARKN